MRDEMQLTWSPQLIERFWDHYSQRPETYFTYQYGDRIVDTLRVYFPLGPCVLDFGCGAGLLIEKLLAAGYATFGCDISPDSVALVNRKFEGASGFGGAFLSDHLPADQRFDLVFVVEVVEHLHDEELAEVFSQVRQLLGNAGRAIFTTPNDENLGDSMVYCPVCQHEFHRWQHVRTWNATTLGQRLEEEGFRLVASLATDFSARPRSPRPERFYKRAIRRIFDLPMYADRVDKPHLACVCERA